MFLKTQKYNVFAVVDLKFIDKLENEQGLFYELLNQEVLKSLKITKGNSNPPLEMRTFRQLERVLAPFPELSLLQKSDF